MNPGAPDICVVFVTAPADKAPSIAQKIVERSAAACVNVLPSVRSIYRWEGKVQDEPEALLMIKTTREGFERLKAAVVEIHPYEVPEIIALPVLAAHAPYAEWVARCVA